jgi:Trm5-related predicted tRNA methylase
MLTITGTTEQFIKSVQHEKDEEERLRAIEINKRKVRGPLDPLIETLVSFEDEEQLRSWIDRIYRLLDMDDSGRMSFEELQSGVRKLSGG